MNDIYIEARRLAWQSYLDAITPSREAYNEAKRVAWKVYEEAVTAIWTQKEEDFEAWKRKRKVT